MSVSSTRTVSIVYSGDVTGTQTIAAATNAASPGQVDIVTLSSGANTINVPSGGSTPSACTIVPPTGNAVSITLKGITGDTGIRIHNTDPTTVAVDTSVTSFVLTAGSSIAGVRLFWS